MKNNTKKIVKVLLGALGVTAVGYGVYRFVKSKKVELDTEEFLDEEDIVVLESIGGEETEAEETEQDDIPAYTAYSGDIDDTETTKRKPSLEDFRNYAMTFTTDGEMVFYEDDETEDDGLYPDELSMEYHPVVTSIDACEMGEDSDYDLGYLTYFSDGVLCDSNYRTIDNPESVIGREALTAMLNVRSEQDDDAIAYVRNDRLRTYYEVEYSEDTYKSAVEHGYAPYEGF